MSFSKELVPEYSKLITKNQRARVSVERFFDRCRDLDYFNNRFIRTMLFLDEIQLKENSEKTQFFAALSDVVVDFPEDSCKYKILPQLIEAFQYAEAAGSTIITPLLKLARLLEEDEYQAKVIPCILRLFASPDRQTRVKLLQKLDHFADFLQPAILNDKLFAFIVQGFSDTNPVIRESTLKSILHFAPKLNKKNLNEELMKHLAHLQTKDDQGGIRANTTVCLGKIAQYLDPSLRQKILISAFTRALKDPFPASRQAAVLAISSCHQYFALKESSSRVLPALCPLTMDVDLTVRQHTFKAIKCFLNKLETISEDPSSQETIEKEVLSPAAGQKPVGQVTWTEWAVSKLYKSSSPQRQQASNPTQNEEGKTSSRREPTSSAVQKQSPQARTSKRDIVGTEPDADDGGSWDDDFNDTFADDEDLAETNIGLEEKEGWDDFDDTADLASSSSPISKPHGSSKMTLNAGKHSAATDEGWDSFLSEFSPKAEKTRNLKKNILPTNKRTKPASGRPVVSSKVETVQDVGKQEEDTWADDEQWEPF